MSAIVFDGVTKARERERLLAQAVRTLRVRPRLLTLIFREDETSQLYAKLKQEAAVRVGVDFDRVEVMFNDPVPHVVRLIQQACTRTDVHGVMVQKPSKKVWREQTNHWSDEGYGNWWKTLANVIDQHKDVDCLNDESLGLVYAGQWRVLPATVKAVLTILELALNLGSGVLTTPPSFGLDTTTRQPLAMQPMTVIGRSDLVGKPLAAVLEQFGAKVNLVGSDAEDMGRYTCTSKVVISATGVPGLVKEDILPDGVIAIDVGSPKGDFDFESVKQTASFITPVPDGVGPMTVVSLLENLLMLRYS